MSSEIKLADLNTVVKNVGEAAAQESKGIDQDTIREQLDMKDLAEKGWEIRTRSDGGFDLIKPDGNPLQAVEGESLVQTIKNANDVASDSIKTGEATETSILDIFRNIASKISNSAFGKSISSFIDSCAKSLKEIFQPRAEQVAQTKDCPDKLKTYQDQVGASPEEVLPQSPETAGENQLSQGVLDRLGIKEKMPSNERIMKAIDDLKNDAPTQREKSTYDEIKDKFKDFLKFGALGLAGFFTYEALKQRALQKTGCFRDEVSPLETKNGKIVELTCGTDARAAVPSYQVPIGSVQCNPVSQKSPLQCQVCNNQIIQSGGDNCPCPDTDSVGSQYCSNIQLNTKGGATVTYNYFVHKGTIAEAFGDIMNYLDNIINKAANDLGGALDLLAQIEKFLTYGAFFVVIFLALYFIIWVISFFKGKTGGQAQYTPRPMPPMTQPIPQYMPPMTQPVSQPMHSVTQDTPMPHPTIASLPTPGETRSDPCDYTGMQSWSSDKAREYLSNCSGKIPREIEDSIYDIGFSSSKFRPRRRK